MAEKTTLEFFNKNQDWSLSKFMLHQAKEGKDVCNINSMYKRLLNHFFKFGNSSEKKRAKKYLETFEVSSLLNK